MKKLSAFGSVGVCGAMVFAAALPAVADTYYGVTPKGQFMKMTIKKDKIRFIGTGYESRDCMKGKIKRSRLPYKPGEQWEYKYYRVTKGEVLSFVTKQPLRIGNVTLVRSAGNPDPNSFYEIQVTANKFWASYDATTKQSLERQFGGPLSFSQCGNFF